MLDNIENIPTVEPVWRPVATGPRPPAMRCLLCHRGGCVDSAWSLVDKWWKSQRFRAGPVYSSFGTLDNVGHIPTVEPVRRHVATGPRTPPTRCLLCHKGGCLELAWSSVDQWWRSQRFGAGPIYMQLSYAR